MIMSSSTIYFVTGANRSIGLALVTELVTRPNVYVFAAARTISPSLKELASKNSDKVTIVDFLASDESSNKAAAKIVDDKFGRVDVVLGVAGISDFIGTVEETPADLMTEHFRINTSGMVVLFQAFAPLLRKSENPKFLPFTSGVASLTAYIHLPAGYLCYGATKVALNWMARKIHFENEWLTCFPLAPGVIWTDMSRANRAMDKTGCIGPIQDIVAITPEVAGPMLVDLIEKATRDTHGGEFINIDGQKIPW